MTLRKDTIKELCKELCKLKEFRYSYKQMLILLEKNEFFKKKKVIDENTPYKIFVREQINRGIQLNVILELWEKNKHKIKV